MSPVVTRPRVLIPVFLTAKLNSEVLNSFLEQALVGLDDGRQRLCVVTNVTDVSSTVEPSTPPIKVVDFPFIGLAGRQLREAIASQKRLTDEGFIMLDDQTQDDSCSCRLVSRKQAHFFSVRSDFQGAQRSLDAILAESTNMQQLRNEAAMCGGILRNDRVSTRHMATKHSTVTFLNKPTTQKTWETCCIPCCGAQNTPIIPVFCVAELPLKILNEFIEAAKNPPDWDDEAKNNAHIRMVDSLDLSPLSSPTKGLYEELPAFPFLHHTPQTVNDIVRSEFPGTALNCALFVILDSFSAQNGTCIIAENLMRDDPFLMLVRMEFHNAMAVPVSTTLTGMTFDSLTESAMEKDGVDRF